MGYIEMGTDAGTAAGSWFEIGGPFEAQRVLAGIEDCDPEVMDLMPAPLSGEWAGGSLAELGLEGASEQELTDYEMAFSDAFWATVTDVCNHHLGNH
jgi:hypothetical protein